MNNVQEYFTLVDNDHPARIEKDFKKLKTIIDEYLCREMNTDQGRLNVFFGGYYRNAVLDIHNHYSSNGFRVRMLNNEFIIEWGETPKPIKKSKWQMFKDRWNQFVCDRAGGGSF